MTDNNVKEQVRKFYDQVGWQVEEGGVFQNARYEDLRPVSAKYIYRCHMRVKRHLADSGMYYLDAGSGPVQYDAYLEYSKNYRWRVCMDLSIVALKEARKKLATKGLYVVADISRLPFKSNAFDGISSLHTIHHLPAEEKVACYENLYRCLKPGKNMVTVDGWTHPPLERAMRYLIVLANKLQASKRQKEIQIEKQEADLAGSQAAEAGKDQKHEKPQGTYVIKNDAKWFKRAVNGRFPYKILVWRSVSVNFLRSVIQPKWCGRFWLWVLYGLEELFPRYFGENGQYPLIVISKPQD